MSIKTSLVLAAVGGAVFASAACAGGVVTPPQPSYAGVYVEGNIGWARTRWQNNYGTPAGNSWSTGNSGFAWGADIGYQFNEFIALEAGGFGLPTAKRNSATGVQNLKVQSWSGYIGGKIMVPLYEQLQLFGKFAAGYNKVKASYPTYSTSNSNWAPAFAAGAQYWFNPNVVANVQLWAFRSGISTQLYTITAGLGYKFSV